MEGAKVDTEALRMPSSEVIWNTSSSPKTAAALHPAETPPTTTVLTEADTDPSEGSSTRDKLVDEKSMLLTSRTSSSVTLMCDGFFPSSPKSCSEYSPVVRS